LFCQRLFPLNYIVDPSQVCPAYIFGLNNKNFPKLLSKFEKGKAKRMPVDVTSLTSEVTSRKYEKDRVKEG
jgi:hypothetical protein